MANPQISRAERYAQIAALREAGHTYKQIGEVIGVTRERVRQLLHKMGRADLTGYFPAPEESRPCVICGNRFRVLCSSRRHLCGNQRCRKLSMRQKHGRRGPDERAERIIELRCRHEMSWLAIGEMLYPKAGNWSVAMVRRDVQRYEARHECDLSYLFFNLHSLRAERRRRKAAS